MKKKSLNQYFEDYILYCRVDKRRSPETIKGYKQVFALFQKLMSGIEYPEDLNKSVMRKYLAKLDTRPRKVGKGEIRVGVKASTVRTHWSKLRSFFNYLIEEKVIEVSPLAKVKPLKPDYSDKRELSKKDFKKLLSAIHCQYKNPLLMRREMAMLGILFFCGLRRGELIGLEVQDIDLDKLVLRVRGETSKSKVTRLMPIHSLLAIYLDDYMQARNKKKYTCEKLFVSSNQDKGLTVHGMKHWVNRLIKLSGVKFHLHRLRHTFATNLARSRVNPISIQNLMGHTDLRMTTRYVRSLSVEDHRQEVEKLSLGQG